MHNTSGTAARSRICLFPFFVLLEKETDGTEIRNSKANEGSHQRTPRRDSTHVGSRLADGARGGNRLQK